MFVGHFAVGLAAKKLAPKTSVGTLFAAAQFLDLLWPVLLLVGLESVEIEPGNTAVTPLKFTHYPISHSLLMAVVWGLLLGLAYGAVRRQWTAAAVVGVLVVSHWFLDAVVHRPDLPLYPGGTARIGLGLWDSVVATVVLEIVMFGLAIWIYIAATSPRDLVGRFSFLAFCVALLAINVANMFGPPPPNVQAIAWVTLSMWLLVLWGWWFDRHRLVIPNEAKRHLSS